MQDVRFVDSMFERGRRQDWSVFHLILFLIHNSKLPWDCGQVKAKRIVCAKCVKILVGAAPDAETITRDELKATLPEAFTDKPNAIPESPEESRLRKTASEALLEYTNLSWRTQLEALLVSTQ